MKMADVRTRLSGILTAVGCPPKDNEKATQKIMDLMTKKMIQDLERAGLEVTTDYRR
jgi:hypothetical protein